MNQDAVAYYLNCFKKLRRDKNAPHKPILLLSIIRLYERELILSNRIYLSAELKTTFKELWSLLIPTRDVGIIILPYFHMRSSPFWKLICFPGKQYTMTKSKSIKSYKNLRETVDYAQIDPELHLLFLDEKARHFLYNEIVECYFERSVHKYTVPVQYKIEADYMQQFVNEDRATYTTRWEQLQRDLNKDDLLEEMKTRSSFFKKKVKELYNYQCCITKLKIESDERTNLIDACHIRPFKPYEDDRICNGIPLTPTLHRAFDRGLITITTDFKVKVKNINENLQSPYNLTQFEGQSIVLPKDESLWPDVESLEWHDQHVYLG